MGGGDGAAAEDNFIPGDKEQFAAAVHFYADSLVMLEADAADGAVGADGEVEAMAGGVQVGQGGALADAVRVVQGERANAGGVGVVQIRVVGVAQVAAGAVKGGLQGEPSFRGMAAHRYGAGCAVEIVPNVGVGFQFAEVGQGLEVAPLVVAGGSPSIEVLGQAAQEYLMIDGAGAAGDPAAGDGSRLRALGRGIAEERPVVRRAGAGGGLVQVVFQFRRQGFRVRVVGAGLEEQHGAGRVLG